MMGQQNYVEFNTGAVREGKAGKGDYSLLPPFALHQLAKLMQENAGRVPARNWESGLPLSSYVDSGMRHIGEYMMGMDDENHLLRWAWNALCAADTVERVKAGMLPAELLDCGAYEKLYVEKDDACSGCGDSEKCADTKCGRSTVVMLVETDYLDPSWCADFNEESCRVTPCADCMLCLIPMGER